MADKLNLDAKTELMKWAAEIAKSAAGSSHVNWSLQSLVLLMETSYVKMVQLLESDGPPSSKMPLR